MPYNIYFSRSFLAIPFIFVTETIYTVTLIGKSKVLPPNSL